MDPGTCSPKPRQQDQYSSNGDLDVWGEPEKQRGHLTAESLECGPELVTDTLLRSRWFWVEGGRERGRRNLAQAHELGWIHSSHGDWTRGLGTKRLVYLLDSKWASVSYRQLLQHISDFPEMLEFVNLHQDRNVLRIFFLLHKKLKGCWQPLFF